MYLLSFHSEAYRRMQNAGKIGHRSDRFFSLNSGNVLFTPARDGPSLVANAEIDEFYNRHNYDES